MNRPTLTLLHFTVEHVPGRNMGFANYLSRNPTGDAIPLSEEDKNFVVNTIDEINFTLLRKALSSNGVNNATNHIENKLQMKQLNQFKQAKQQKTLSALTRFKTNYTPLHIFSLNR